MTRIVVILLTLCLSLTSSELIDSTTNFFTAYRDFSERMNQLKEWRRNVSMLTMSSSMFDMTIGQANYSILSTKCQNQLDELIYGLNRSELWAYKVVDSFGRRDSGLIQGSLNWVGEYKQCVEIEEWPTKYCSLKISKLTIGLCMPSECQIDEIRSILSEFVSLLEANENSTDVSCVEEIPFDAGAIVAITILSLIGALVLIGTLYDLYLISKKYLANKIQDQQVKPNETSEVKEAGLFVKLPPEEKKDLAIWSRILLGCSIYSNTVKLFKVSPSPDQIKCLHGIRAISIGWIVLGHVYQLVMPVAENLAVVDDWVKRFSFIIITNAFFSVDTFFVLSGFLTCYLFLKTVDKSGLTKMMMLKYYIHRFLRITPPYMLVLMFSATLTKYLAAGPFYPSDGFERDKCAKTWWANLLYINNFMDLDNMCFPVGWYLANDVQFTWLAPIILIPLALGHKIIGLVLAGLFLVANILSTALVINKYPGIEFGLANVEQFDKSMVYFTEVYVKPWCRIGPYIVGLMLGYVARNFRKKLRTDVNLMINVASVTIMALMVFGLYPNFTDNKLDRVANILYQSSSRIIWALCVSSIIYSCMMNGGLVNKFLSMSVWVPFSRISFCLYLTHFIVITYFYRSLEKPYHLQDSTMIASFSGNLVISLMTAYIASMSLEVPFSAIEKIFL